MECSSRLENLIRRYVAYGGRLQYKEPTLSFCRKRGFADVSGDMEGLFFPSHHEKVVRGGRGGDALIQSCCCGKGVRAGILCHCFGTYNQQYSGALILHIVLAQRLLLGHISGATILLQSKKNITLTNCERRDILSEAALFFSFFNSSLSCGQSAGYLGAGISRVVTAGGDLP